MTIDSDAEKLLAHMDSLGIDASTERTRGWQSIGAIIVDAALQRRQNYTRTVRPRVAALVAAWPDADTTTGFRRRLDSGELSKTISWRTPGRLTQIDHITRVLERPDIAIDTVHQLRDHLKHPAKRIELRTALRAVLHVGPKTLDYFDILSGIPTGVAIDVRIRRVAEAAGINNKSYDHLSAVIREAAHRRGWRPGDLDGTLWDV
ncbi:hypothetical protein OOZ51_14300 [Arthrobacter sp. MI7-26]|uniref:hypothetical protein n=1 Tax=Arthrobacter sp. MI7-26 TaxID=2993653 RepID=UPI002248A46D|nr:hypothetical protein [Arthrobacter sp. MI7-26]MCX2748976.1 hypothetical protein [Arthrobacter sp. MI7-26]